MNTYEVKRRTFEAEKFPGGSDERAKLNCDTATSEYMHSYKYAVVSFAPTMTFRTKSEAQDYADRKNKEATQ